MLCLVSTFIFFTAGGELKQVQWDTVLNDKTADDVLNGDYGRLQADSSIKSVMDLASKGIEKNYLVFRDEELIGYLPHYSILYALKNKLGAYPISALTKLDFQTVSISDPLKGIFQHMQVSGVPIMPVVQEGQIIGTIEDTQVRKYVDMQLQTK
jgi:predicted transcriptional regulator